MLTEFQWKNNHFPFQSISFGVKCTLFARPTPAGNLISIVGQIMTCLPVAIAVLLMARKVPVNREEWGFPETGTTE